MKRLLFTAQLFFATLASAQNLSTPYQLSNFKGSATYAQTVAFYKQLAANSKQCKLLTLDSTDAGEPLLALIYSPDASFDPARWKAQKKLVMLVMNGIHAGEPDGIDASMEWLNQLRAGNEKLPSNMVLVIIPVYNIGGMKNRSATSRVNQNGPVQYGFRGNSQNLDLNRDFIKADSKEAIAFARLFHRIQPHVFIDNHVSDGADYQHTLTILTTQHNKLGGKTGQYLNTRLEPAIYKQLEAQNIKPIPYVNFDGAAPRYWPAFYDAPRYSCGYAALWGCMGFTTETHMLKPYKQRVEATLAFMRTVASECSRDAETIWANKTDDAAQVQKQTRFALRYTIDTSQHTPITFSGYEDAMRTSSVTGQPILHYDHSKPYTKTVRFYNVYQPADFVTVPRVLYMPAGFYKVAERLMAGGIQMKKLNADTSMQLRVKYIKKYETGRLFEGHRRNMAVETSDTLMQVKLYKGDYMIYTAQPGRRYLAEMLHPQSEDGFFAWNFFDAILQQKEYFADYRFEPVAAELLAQNAVLREKFESRKKADQQFAQNGAAQLDFIYKNSVYYEPVHMRYPVFSSLD